MTRALQIGAFLLLSVIVADAQSFFERTGVNSFLGISPSTQDFISEVVRAEMFEISLSKLAEQIGGPKTKLFAARMVNEHSNTSAELREMVQGGEVKVSYPTSLSAVQMAQLDKLQKLNSPEFDVQFEAVQAELHRATIDLFERYGSDGTHPDLKLYAYRHLPHIEEHWRSARALKD